MKVSEIVEQTREITRLFDQEVGVWSVEVMVTELVAKVGALADSIMIQEGHRPARPAEPIDLEDDIADVLCQLIRLADHYHIDLAQSYQAMLLNTRQKLLARLQQQKDQTKRAVRER
jgi:NTP pyrophosphatase (non-canonical NTP hydrolase)